jgi:alcohol dehydrogenase class IV
VDNALEAYRDFNPDLIIGLGGGSPIDVAKGFRIFLENPDLTFEGVRYFGGPPKTPIPPFKKTLFIGIATTSGTGSEVTWAAAITDPTINVKCVVGSPNLIPNIAILDPDLVDSMPKVVQADSGLDALAHAIESYTSLGANDLSRAYAFRSSVLLLQYLTPAYVERDSEAIERVHYAASMAGCGLSNSGLGVDHVVATQVGATFHLTHGRACAVTLPQAIKFNGDAAGDLYLDLARATGYNGTDPKGGVDHLVESIIGIQKNLEMPGNYRDAGVPEDEYKAQLQTMLDNSKTHPGTVTNPRQYDLDELKLLYDASYYGDYSLI